MKNKLLEDLLKLKENTKENGFLFKRYDKWIKIIEQDLPLSQELIQFLYSKASHTENSQFSNFLIDLIEKRNNN